MFWMSVLWGCLTKKSDIAQKILEPLQIEFEIPVLDIEKEPISLDETVIIANNIERESWNSLPEEIRVELEGLEKEFQSVYSISYKQDDDDYNSVRLLIEKKQEVLDFGEHAVLFYEKDRTFEERCASAFYSGFAELRYRDMALHYSLPSHLSPLAKAILLDKLEKKGAPPREGGAGLVARILNTYIRRDVKSIYADRAIAVLAQYMPEEYTLPFEGAGVQDYLDVLNQESEMIFFPKYKWEGTEEYQQQVKAIMHNQDLLSSIETKCSVFDDENAQYFCLGANTSNAMLVQYTEPSGLDFGLEKMKSIVENARNSIQGYWKGRLEKWVRSNHRAAALSMYTRSKKFLLEDQLPLVFETGGTVYRSDLAKEEHAIGHVTRIMYNLRQLEERLIPIPQTKSQRRRYVKIFPEHLYALQNEAENVLHSYPDQKKIRQSMLLVMGRVALLYYTNAQYAYKGLSSHDEQTVDQHRAAFYVLAKSLFVYLSGLEDGSEASVEASEILKSM